MLRLDLKDFMCDNFKIVKPMKLVYCGRFMLYTKWVDCSLKEISDILTKNQRPYDYFEAQDFMWGVRSSLVLSDGYDTYKLILHKNV